MKLDSEEQRILLLTIIKSTPMQGSFEQVEQATEQMKELRNAVQGAEIIEDVEGK